MKKDDILHKEKMAFIAKIFPKEKGKILDIGCYKGELGLNLPGYGYYGLDINKESIEEGKKKGLKMIYCDIDKEDMPFKENFNYIVALDVLEHLHNPTKVLNEFKRKLEDDGFLIISLPNDFHILNRIRFVFGKAIYPDPFWEHTHLHLFTKKQAKEFLKTNNIKIIKTYELPGTFPPLLSFKIKQVLARFLPCLFSRGTLFFLKIDSV